MTSTPGSTTEKAMKQWAAALVILADGSSRGDDDSPEDVARRIHDLLSASLPVDGVWLRLRDPVTGSVLIEDPDPPRDHASAPAPAAGGSPPRAESVTHRDKVLSQAIGEAGDLGALVIHTDRTDLSRDLQHMLLRLTAREVEIVMRHGMQRTRVSQHDAIIRLGLRALDTTDFDHLLRVAVDTIRRALRVDLVHVLELTSDGRSFVVRAGAGWDDGVVGSVHENIAGSGAAHVLETGGAVVMDDVGAETRFRPAELLVRHGVASGITVPLHGQAGPRGVIGAYTRARHAFTADDVQCLRMIATLLDSARQRQKEQRKQEALYRQTAAARSHAEDASRTTSDYLAYMSHELRTPLNAIAGYAELMESGIHGPITTAQRHDLDRIRTSQQYLLGLISNVLTFLKAGSGHMDFQIGSVELDATLATVEDLVLSRFEAGRIHYHRREAGSDVRVCADRDKLQHIVLNLLGNAAKFTGADGRVVVECTTEADRVSIHVRDTGCGIPPAELDRVFQPFVQSRGRRAGEGTGLGLAISRQFATGMGGSIRVESEPDRGSDFTVVLPRCRSDGCGAGCRRQRASASS